MDRKSYRNEENPSIRPTILRQNMSGNSRTIGLPAIFVKSFYVQSEVPDSSTLLGYDNGIQKNGILPSVSYEHYF